MHNNIKDISTFANMLSKTFGYLIQITISDTKKYLFVENAIDVEISVGNDVCDNEKYFAQNEEFSQLPFVVNYKSLSSNMKKLRSSTYFYKNMFGDIEYMLSITTCVDEFIYIRNVLDTFTNGTAISRMNTNIDNIPKLTMSMNDLIDSVVSEGQKKYNTVVEYMTKTEKQSLIREMHSRGAFLIKGAVTEVAEKLNYSEATIYRFLQKLEVK